MHGIKETAMMKLITINTNIVDKSPDKKMKFQERIILKFYPC